jgi:putative selenium metabolism hydrolase
MTPVINAVRKLGSKMKDDGYLGKGTVAVTEIISRAPSHCAIPDLCRIHLDRRLTAGETDKTSLDEIRALPEVRAANAEVSIPDYSKPSYRGYHYMVKKYYPAWVLDRDHSLVQAGLRTAESLQGSAARLGTWNFSTNGVATQGMFGIPTIGFGPSEEKYAHTPDDRCPIDHLVTAGAFYALLPWILDGLVPAPPPTESVESADRG